MWLECTCVDINKKRWDELMKGARPLNYNWLVKKIKKELPKVYRNLDLDLYNPYSKQCYVTKTHYILVHSCIEYFFNKGEDPNKEFDDDDEYDYNNIYYENTRMKKNILKEDNDLPSNIFSSKITPEEHEIGLKLARFSTKETSFLFGGMLEYFSTVAKILLNKFPKYDVENMFTNPYEIIDCWIESSIETNGLEPKWQNITRYAGRKKSTMEFVEWFRNVALPRMGEKLNPNSASQINDCLKCLEDYALIQQKVEELKKERVFMQNVLYQLAICKHRLQVFNSGEDNEIFRNSSYKNGKQTIPLGCHIRKSTIVKLLQIIVDNLLNNQNTLNMKTTIKLTESDLHRIIRNSVAKILKEQYGVAPDGRQIDQQAAQQAANTPTSWKAYAQMNRTLANRGNHNGARIYGNKAQNAATQQIGYTQKNQDNVETVSPNFQTGTLSYYQDNMDNLMDKGQSMIDANFSGERGRRGFYRNFGGGEFKHDETIPQYMRKNAENFSRPSKEAGQAYDNALTDVYDYGSGSYGKRMASKGKQLGNGGVYESKRPTKRNKLVE